VDRVQQRLGGACWCSTLRGTVMSSMRALLRTSVLLASWVGCAPAATAEESGAACSPEQLKSLLRRSDATIARLEARMLDLEWQVGWETNPRAVWWCGFIDTSVIHGGDTYVRWPLVSLGRWTPAPNPRS
jgi:hypothetical protein